MGVIYKITNKINSKIYIGKKQSDIDDFIKSDYWGSGKIIKEAIKKYGICSFIREVIDSSEDNNILCEKEKYWIKELNSKNPNGYNIADGGNGPLNGITKESLKKRSLALKGRKWTKEQKRNTMIKNGTLNKSIEGFFTLEAKEKRRQKLLGKKHTKKHTKEHNEKIGISNIGKHSAPKTEEIKQKISKTLKGNVPWNKGLKNSQIPWNKGIKTGSLPKETCIKMSMSRKGHPSGMLGKKLSKEHLQALISANTGRKRSEQARQNMKEAWAKRKANKILNEITI